MKDSYSHTQNEEKQSLQTALEEAYAKSQAKPVITEHLVNIGIGDVIKEAGYPYQAAMAAMVQMCILKRAKFQALAGMLFRHFSTEDNPAIAVTNMLTDMTKLGLLNWQDRDREFVVVYDIPEHIQIRLNRLQYPLPMVVEPVKVRHNGMTGYETIRGSLMLKSSYTDKDICLDHINRANAVPLRLNMNIVAFVKNHWKGVDKQKDDETVFDFRKRQRAFNKYNESAFDVIEMLAFAEERFWLTHKYDKRGRCYSQGYHVNTQGNSYNKASIELAEGEPLNDN